MSKFPGPQPFFGYLNLWKWNLVAPLNAYKCCRCTYCQSLTSLTPKFGILTWFEKTYWLPISYQIDVVPNVHLTTKVPNLVYYVRTKIGKPATMTIDNTHKTFCYSTFAERINICHSVAMLKIYSLTTAKIIKPEYTFLMQFFMLFPKMGFVFSKIEKRKRLWPVKDGYFLCIC